MCVCETTNKYETLTIIHSHITIEMCVRMCVLLWIATGCTDKQGCWVGCYVHVMCSHLLPSVSHTQIIPNTSAAVNCTEAIVRTVRPNYTNTNNVQIVAQRPHYHQSIQSPFLTTLGPARTAVRKGEV